MIDRISSKYTIKRIVCVSEGGRAGPRLSRYDDTPIPPPALFRQDLVPVYISWEKAPLSIPPWVFFPPLLIGIIYMKR